MKKIILLLLLTVLFSCKEKQHKNTIPTSSTIENFDWLLGNWERTNDKDDKKTFENWISKNETNYSGIGFTMKGKDTISKEIMKIVKENNQWKLIVESTGKGDDSGAVTFNFSSKSSTSFTFENKEIDFPNTIHYKRDGDTLNATVANSEMTIPFSFIKLVK